MNKKNFYELWEDSTKYEILNQYYYDYKEIERLNNIINEFDKISYEDWNMWGKYREYIKILSEFADDTQSKLNPYLTDAYKSDIKVAIKVLIRVLKESYTKDKIEELENIIKEVREEVKEARLWNWTEQKILIDKFTKRLLEILDKR